MKITYIQDLCPNCNGGGGQLNDRAKIEEGIKRGHKINVVTPQNINQQNIDCDLLIISNHVSFPKEIMNQLCSKYPYVFYHKDYNFYPYRLYFYKGEECKKFPDKGWWSRLYNNAKGHIWLSPLHRDHFLYIFPELEKFKSCIPSSIDTEMFKPVEGVERKQNTVIGINSLAEFKGRYNVYNYCLAHPEMQFTFVGEGPEINLPNVNYIAFVRNEDLPKLYSQFEYAIALNCTSEPFGRVLVEARLCGCKIITNELYGAFSYPDMDYNNIEKLKSQLSLASIAFWEEIGEIMRNK